VIVIILGIFVLCLQNRNTNKLPEDFTIVLQKGGCSSGGSCSNTIATLRFEDKVLVSADVNEYGSGNAVLDKKLEHYKLIMK